jgi:hypothetical protein
MTSERAIPQSPAAAIAQAAEVMKVFREQTLPRIVLAEQSMDGLRTWWADWKRRQA